MSLRGSEMAVPPGEGNPAASGMASTPSISTRELGSNDSAWPLVRPLEEALACPFLLGARFRPDEPRPLPFAGGAVYAMSKSALNLKQA